VPWLPFFTQLFSDVGLLLLQSNSKFEFEENDMLQPVACTNQPCQASNPRTILLVEDEPFVRDATRNILENAGFRVFPAENAVDAMRVYENCPCAIDLLMTDMVLPGRTGHQLGKDLRQLSPQVNVLVTSGYGNAEYDNEDPASRTYFLAKPYSRRSLLEKIGTILERQTAQSAATQAS
jgi:two-component system, cell cycle sensor histidine kinase and response regulator CckA